MLLLSNEMGIGIVAAQNKRLAIAILNVAKEAGSSEINFLEMT